MAKKKTRSKGKKRRQPEKPPWETSCPESPENKHCLCWYDGDRCCWCGDRCKVFVASRCLVHSEECYG